LKQSRKADARGLGLQSYKAQAVMGTENVLPMTIGRRGCGERGYRQARRESTLKHVLYGDIFLPVYPLERFASLF